MEKRVSFSHNRSAESQGSDSARVSKPPGKALECGLYMVATPIGNSADLSFRAHDILSSVDLVACEDTRVTSKLFAIHGIKASMISYHEHNAQQIGPGLIERLKKGNSVALVSDAGTPLISDPGYRLVEACHQQGVSVTAVPGPSAVTAALSVSGLPTDRFFFQGFLPPKSAARKTLLLEISEVPATLVILESAKRLPVMLAEAAEVLGPRPAAMTREISKLFEEVRRGRLDELAAHYAEAGPPKGEVTMVIGGTPVADPVCSHALDRLISRALKEMSLSAAAKYVAAETGLPRKRVYSRALELCNEGAP
jgi:16S rRNA (cytidine1402-2'-O)-methyltransferase